MSRVKTAPVFKCPKFEKCNAPICPLDPEMKKRIYRKGDERCNIEKSIRVKLGSSLQWKGKLPSEIAGENTWASHTEDIRQMILKSSEKRRFPTAVKSDGSK